MSFEGKNLYGQYIDYSEKIKWPKGFICPYTGNIFYMIRLYSRSQVSVYRTIGPLVFFSFAKTKFIKSMLDVLMSIRQLSRHMGKLTICIV